MLDNLFHQQCSESKAGSQQEIVEVFINAANSGGESMSFEDFQNWCTLVPAVRKYLGCLLEPSDAGFSLKLSLLIYVFCAKIMNLGTDID